jgi:outer membrane immunogenic protein
MKKIIAFGSVALAVQVVASSAQAADLKAAAAYASVPPITASSWTGFYAGLGLGFRTTRTDGTTTSETNTGVSQDLTGLATSLPFDGTAFRANPYAGFNWQFAQRWIVGIEGDIGFADQTTTLAGFGFSPGRGSFGFAADGLAVKTKWDTSLRGRFGFLLTPTTLAYATSGIAWQRYDVISTCGSTTGVENPCIGATPAVIANSATRPGWTIGGGLETALWGHWLARGEYRYADFGTAPDTIARAVGGEQFVDSIGVKLRTHTATFGLAYKFGDPIASEIPGEMLGAFENSPAMSWGGLYVGFGLGARASRTDLTTTAAIEGSPVNLNGFATSQPFDGTAFRANPYVGFNWQFAPRWVAGIEGDFGFANKATTLTGFVSPLVETLQAADGLTLKTTWDASLRGRVGFLLTPATLAYMTGGAAWQQYEMMSNCVSAFCVTNGLNPPVIANKTTKPGWTVGGGIETALWGHWLARAEYRYSDFGTEPFTIGRSTAVSIFNPLIDIVDLKLRTHIVTFGLAYKFN